VAKILQAPDLREMLKPHKKPPMQAPDLRPKKNPTLVYCLHVQKLPSGPVMTWNGKSFDNNAPAKIFSRADTAKKKGKELRKTFPILRDYRIWVQPKFHEPVTITQKGRAMRG
jgi:hypothetical protein